MDSFRSQRAPATQKTNALASKEGAVVKDVLRKTNFKVDKEIYRNYDNKRGAYEIRSIIFKGVYENKPAVLKLHGLEYASKDAEMTDKFNEQNRSKIIRAPKIFASMKWSSGHGYGFTIFEYIDAPKIYAGAIPTSLEIRNFTRFYQEYRTKAITRPWTKAPNPSRLVRSYFDMIEEWRTVAKLKGRLKYGDYAPYLSRFYAIATKDMEAIPLAFMHRHLYPEHILKLPDKKYVLLDHMSWGYRHEWGDLSYMTWKSMLSVRDNNFTAEDMIKSVDKLIDAYKRIPLVKKDKEFDFRINLLVLERCLGIIVGDLGGGRYWGTKEGKKYFGNMLKNQHAVFDAIANKLE